MSSYSGEAAEQVVRMTLDGVDVAVRLAGTGAKHLAVLLYSVLKDQKRTRGKIRLTSLLRSGKELKVFSVGDKDLTRFCTEAKRYGVLYTVLKDRDANDGFSDVMVRAEDASKINRIFTRFGLTTVDQGSVRAQVVQALEKAEAEKAESATNDAPEPQKTVMTTEQKNAEFVEMLVTKPEEERPNPEEGRTLTSPRSEPSSKKRSPTERDASERPAEERPSVRKELEEIRKELNEKASKEKEPQKPLEHKAPKKKRKKEKTRE